MKGYQSHHSVRFLRLTLCSLSWFISSKSFGQYEETRYIYNKESEIVKKMVSAEKNPQYEMHLKDLSWLGRISYIDSYCDKSDTKVCLPLLLKGLDDRAMVVRDHCLQVFLKLKGVSESQKKDVFSKILGDTRNYRKSRPLWIIDRVKNAQNPPSSTNYAIKSSQTP